MKQGQYWDVMWNPIKMRCTKASAGCKNCWHLRFANRHAANPNMPKRWQDAWAGKDTPFLDPRTLSMPRSWRKPRVIFTQTMGDIFHESIPLKFQQQIWCEMLDARQHLFLVLTKRPLKLLEFYEVEPDLFDYPAGQNIITGISAENQDVMNDRWYTLCQVPGRHWASLEPLLGPVGVFYGPGMHNGYTAKMPDWVAFGPETGHGARPAHPEWMDAIASQCGSLGIPFFDKRKANPIAHMLPRRVR